MNYLEPHALSKGITMTNIPLTIRDKDNQEQQSHASVEFTKTELKVTEATGEVHFLPLSRVLGHWAEQSHSPLIISYAPHRALSSQVNTLLKNEWVKRLTDSDKETLTSQIKAAKVPSAALIRQMWAAQGSTSIIKLPRAEILNIVLQNRGWTLYKGIVHTIETLGDITSNDIVAVYTESSGSLRMYQTTETIVQTFLSFQHETPHKKELDIPLSTHVKKDAEESTEENENDEEDT